jgi:hypothetical protein
LKADLAAALMFSTHSCCSVGSPELHRNRSRGKAPVALSAMGLQQNLKTSWTNHLCMGRLHLQPVKVLHRKAGILFVASPVMHVIE